MASGRKAASRRAARSACMIPVSLSGMSVWPWKRSSSSTPSARAATAPGGCRAGRRRRSRGRPGRSAGVRSRRGLPPARGDRLGQPDDRAVLPEALQRVEHPLIRVLHVNDDINVVEQHPAAVPLPLPADGLGSGLAQLQLDLIDDGPDLGRRPP